MIIFLIVGLIIFSTFSALNGFSVIASMATAISSLGTLILLYLTKQSLEEMRKKRKLEEEPIISIKVKPEHTNSPFLYFVIKNTGGSPAYDVSINFDPDIKYYGDTTLNDIKAFKRIPIIDKGEVIEIFFDASYNFFDSDKPNETKAKISYYMLPMEKYTTSKEREENKEEKTIDILFDNMKGPLKLVKRDFDDLVKEVEEIKQGLLMLLWEIQDNKNTSSKEDDKFE